MITRLLFLLSSILLLLPGLTATKAYAQKQYYKNDTTFNFNAEHPARIDKVFKLSGGSYIIAGEFDFSDKTYDPSSMLRLDSNGNVDRSFKNSIHYSRFVSQVVEQPDKKLLALVSNFSNGIGYELRRHHADGSYDTTFTSLPIQGSIHTIALQQNGSILVGGDFSVFNNTDHKNLVRLLADGTIDKSFAIGAGPAGEVLQIIPMGSEILVSGSFSSFDGFPQSKYMVALSQNGKVLRSYFSDNFICSSCSIRSVTVDEVKNIYFYASGAIFSPENYFIGLGKIKPDGSIDHNFYNPYTFRSDFRYLEDPPAKIIIDRGYLYLVGSIRYANHKDVYDSWAVVRLLADGRIDGSFRRVYGRANDAVLVGDDLLLAGQLGITYNSQRASNMLLVDQDGKLIPDFKPDLRIETHISTAVLQNDSTVFLAGGQTYLGNVPSTYVTKVSLRGKIDSSFGTQLGPFFTGRIVSAPDGLYSIENSKISKLTLTGELDPNFKPIDLHVPFTRPPQIGPIASVDQNKLIISYTQGEATQIVKYNADGTPDDSFKKGTFGEAGRAFAIAVQPDGKILVAGKPTIYNGTSVKALFRLHKDGSIDNSFDIGSGIATSLPSGGAYISVVEVVPNGDILISGFFDTFENAPSESKIIRLGPNGSFKEFVMPQHITISNIKSLQYVPSDSSIIMTGYFINSYNSFQVAKLRPYTPLPELPLDAEGNDQVFTMFPNPATEFINVKLSGRAGSMTTIRILSSYGQVLYEQRLESDRDEQIVEIPLNALSPGIYLIDVTTNSIRSVKRILKL